MAGIGAGAPRGRAGGYNNPGPIDFKGPIGYNKFDFPLERLFRLEVLPGLPIKHKI